MSNRRGSEAFAPSLSTRGIGASVKESTPRRVSPRNSPAGISDNLLTSSHPTPHHPPVYTAPSPCVGPTTFYRYFLHIKHSVQHHITFPPSSLSSSLFSSLFSLVGVATAGRDRDFNGNGDDLTADGASDNSEGGNNNQLSSSRYSLPPSLSHVAIYLLISCPTSRHAALQPSCSERDQPISISQSLSANLCQPI